MQGEGLVEGCGDFRVRRGSHTERAVDNARLAFGIGASAQRLLYDRKEAARQLSISVRSLDYLIGQQKLSTRRLGKKVLVPHAELVRFASANHYEPMTPEERTDAA